MSFPTYSRRLVPAVAATVGLLFFVVSLAIIDIVRAGGCPELSDNQKTSVDLRSRGLALAAKGKLDCGIALVRRSIELTDPDDPALVTGRKTLAKMYEHSGQITAAENTWHDLVAQFSRSSYLQRIRRGEHLTELGDFYFRQGMNNEAERSYQKAIEAFVEDDSPSLLREQVHRSLIRLYEHLERFSDAADVAERLVEDTQHWVNHRPEDIDLLIAVLEEHQRLLDRAGRVGDSQHVQEKLRKLSDQSKTQ